MEEKLAHIISQAKRIRKNSDCKESRFVADDIISHAEVLQRSINAIRVHASGIRSELKHHLPALPKGG